MEISKYNYFIDRDDVVMGFNARTGNFTLMTKEVAETLKGIGSLENLSNIDELYDLGFIHNSDELKEIESKFKNQRHNNKNVHIALLPTTECNLSCEYCFQRSLNNAQIMSMEIQDAVILYTYQLCSKEYEFFQISWYGGEPLLAADIVIDLTTKMKSIFDRNNKKSEFTMVSNGTLLTLDIAKRLAQAGLKSVQISVDSLYEKENRRGVMKKNGELSEIINNAIAAKNELEVSVRINVDKTNEEEIKQIVDILRIKGLEYVSMARIHDYEIDDKSSLNKGKDNNLISPLTFAKLENSCLLNTPFAFPLMLRRLRPKSHFCAATSGVMIVVGPDGNITRCWETVGIDSLVVGNIKENKDLDYLHKDKWLMYSVLDRQECRECKVLPLCMGSCANPIIVRNFTHSTCESIKYNINNCVKAVGMHLEITEEQMDAIQ